MFSSSSRFAIGTIETLVVRMTEENRTWGEHRNLEAELANVTAHAIDGGVVLGRDCGRRRQICRWALLDVLRYRRRKHASPRQKADLVSRILSEGALSAGLSNGPQSDYAPIHSRIHIDSRIPRPCSKLPNHGPWGTPRKPPVGFATTRRTWQGPKQNPCSLFRIGVQY